ncbi:MAG: hypothetical protein VCB26_00430, partial [Candidatus Hydrogenedentota bacterium]
RRIFTCRGSVFPQNKDCFLRDEGFKCRKVSICHGLCKGNFGIFDLLLRQIYCLVIGGRLQGK